MKPEPDAENVREAAALVLDIHQRQIGVIVKALRNDPDCKVVAAEFKIFLQSWETMTEPMEELMSMIMHEQPWDEPAYDAVFEAAMHRFEDWATSPMTKATHLMYEGLAIVLREFLGQDPRNN